MESPFKNLEPPKMQTGLFYPNTIPVKGLKYPLSYTMSDEFQAGMSLIPKLDVKVKRYYNHKFVKLKPSLKIRVSKSGSYSAGDTISGELILDTKEVFKAMALRIVVRGLVGSLLKINYESQAFQSVTNLYLFTYLVKSSTKSEMSFPIGKHTYPFSIQLPYTYLPGTLLREDSAVIYKVIAMADRADNICAKLADQDIQLKTYFNLEATKIILTSGGTPIFSNNETRAKSNGQEETLELVSKNPEFKVIFTLLSTNYIPGENIEFKMFSEKISNIQIAVVLLLRTKLIVQCQQIVVKSREIYRIKQFLPSVSWSDKINIPSDIEHVSFPMIGEYQPIVRDYVLRVEVAKCGGVSVTNGELPIMIGTTRDVAHPKPVPLRLGIEKGYFPMGYSELFDNEDIDLMLATGRIGYVESNSQGLFVDTNSGCSTYILDAALRSRFMSMSSLSSVFSFTPSLPPYSALSSRRGSVETLPPTYEEIYVKTDKE